MLESLVVGGMHPTLHKIVGLFRYSIIIFDLHTIGIGLKQPLKRECRYVEKGRFDIFGFRNRALKDNGERKKEVGGAEGD
jgi:hypothetical protein